MKGRQAATSPFVALCMGSMQADATKHFKNPRVRTYIFPSLAKQVLIFGGSYWQFRLN